MKNLLIASSLACASFTALADGSGHQDWLNKAAQPARAAPVLTVARADRAQGEVTQVAQAAQASPRQTAAATADNCGRAGSLFSWKDVAIPAGGES